MTKKNSRNEILIDICPVCKSKEIEQLIYTNLGFSDTGYIIQGDGCFCRKCGVRFFYNSSHLCEELEKEKQMIIHAREKTKREMEKEVKGKE
jgi:hypothetical protein